MTWSPPHFVLNSENLNNITVFSRKKKSSSFIVGQECRKNSFSKNRHACIFYAFLFSLCLLDLEMALLIWAAWYSHWRVCHIHQHGPGETEGMCVHVPCLSFFLVRLQRLMLHFAIYMWVWATLPAACWWRGFQLTSLKTLRRICPWCWRDSQRWWRKNSGWGTGEWAAIKKE